MEIIQKTQQAIDLDDMSYWIADSTLYTEKISSFQEQKQNGLRIYLHSGRSSKATHSNSNMVPCSDPRYAFFATDLIYGDVPQRAVVVWSEEMKKRNEKTFERKIEKRTRIGPSRSLHQKLDK